MECCSGQNKNDNPPPAHHAGSDEAPQTKPHGGGLFQVLQWVFMIGLVVYAVAKISKLL